MSEVMEPAVERRSACRYTSPLSDPGTPEEVGQKADTLARISRLGLPVPSGFVITTAAFDAFLAAGGLAPRIATLCRGLDPVAPPALSGVAEQVRALIVSAPIPGPIWNDILGQRERILPGVQLIVRSSAVGEDSAGASFAGQLDSYLGPRTDGELERAVLECWASYWSARSLFYQRTRGVRLAGMGVIVQALVPAALSGVLFTRHPEAASGDERLLVEYCVGHGDGLASGRVNPGRLVIARSGGAWSSLAVPEQPGGETAARLLTAERIAGLRDAALRLEPALGGPQDIEWAMDGRGRLYIVQSRPITAHTPGHSGASEPSCPGASEGSPVVWSNANISENFPEPVTPLLYSIAATGYAHYFVNLARAFGVSARRVRAMEHPLRHIVGVHGARLYYNLTNIHAVLRMAPGGAWLVEAFNHFVGAAAVAGPPRRAAAWADVGRRFLGQLGELAVIAVRTTWQYLFLARRIERFERTVDDFAARTDPARLARRSLPALLDDFREFLDIRRHRWTDAALADAASMVCYGLLRRILNASFPAPEDSALPTTLLKGSRDIVSARPALALWELSRRIRRDAALREVFATHPPDAVLGRIACDPAFDGVRRELHDFLEQWGFRCSGELMLTVPSLQEEPRAVVELLRTYLDVTGEAPPERLHRQYEERLAATARVLRALAWRPLCRFLPWPTQAGVVARLLGWTRRAVAFRERARLKQSLLYSRCRRIALAMGDRLAARGVLDDRDDIFFLTADELDTLVAGHAMFPYHVGEMIALRRKAHAVLSAMTPADTLVLGEGAYLPRTTGGGEDLGAATGAASSVLAGVGACGGRAQGRAAVLSDVADADRLRAGDVLVTRQTDPGWGPVFLLIRGLVMERGGMLSHGAIIAREYGIPSVVGVRGATVGIRHGQEVVVDGDRGHVRLVD